MPTASPRGRTPLPAPVRFEIKRAGAEARSALRTLAPDGSFEGYASLFEVADLGGDVIAPGAFRDCLRARGPRGIKMLFQHDANEPIGVWDEIREDARGLLVRGRLMLEVARAREVLALMRAGALDGLSIGFKAVTGQRQARSGIRRLTRIDLWEISVVTFPLLPQARVERVKASPARSLEETILAATRLVRGARWHRRIKP
ncbi:MAG: HK97 family phage prohead protease [Hyphomicrobiaceae bacterium]|nr:HK97 family phage prohead protease [Hyphomicrobiaceae bacterium]